MFIVTFIDEKPQSQPLVVVKPKHLIINHY